MFLLPSLRPPHSLLEQDSQKVKHKLLPLIGPFPSQLHSWAALGASIWEGSSDCFTKSCNCLSHPSLPFSPCQPLFCSELCPSNHDLTIQRTFGFWGLLLLRSGPDQSGICPAFAPVSRRHREYRLCLACQDIQSLLQARVRREKQTSQEPTRVTSRLPNSDSSLCRED